MTIKNIIYFLYAFRLLATENPRIPLTPIGPIPFGPPNIDPAPPENGLDPPIISPGLPDIAPEPPGIEPKPPDIGPAPPGTGPGPPVIGTGPPAVAPAPSLLPPLKPALQGLRLSLGMAKHGIKPFLNIEKKNQRS